MIVQLPDREILTPERFIELIADLYAQPQEPMRMMVHPRFVPKIRFWNACHALRVDPNSAKARKIKGMPL